jgi:GTP-binding protein
MINNFKFEFVGSYISIKRLPLPLKFGEIPIFGRSNVGKSSFLNALANVKNMAKTSSTPGKTRTLNYYKVNDKFYFVDLPGYGYAKISAVERKKWGKMVLDYLSNRESISFYIVLIDVRHKLHDTDIKSLELGKFFNKDILVVLTKSDKLNSTRLNQQLTYFKDVLTNYNVFDIVPFSSVTKLGKDDIIKTILDKLGGCYE